MQPRFLLNEGKVKKISQDTKSTLLKRAIFIGSIILRNFVCPEGEPRRSGIGDALIHAAAPVKSASVDQPSDGLSEVAISVLLMEKLEQLK
jgi:hypothetical protein